MSTRLRICCALVCGMVSAFLLLMYMHALGGQALKQRAQALARYGGEIVPVVVSSKPIAAGEEISSKNVTVANWILDLVPEGVQTKLEDVTGKQALYALEKNTPLVASALSGNRLGVRVPEHKVALSIPSVDIHAVGGSLYPGDEVNLYTLRNEGAVLLESSVEILATNVAPATSVSTTDTKSGHLAWITIALSPQRVQEILQASARDNIFVTLPSQDIKEQLNKEAVTMPQNTDNHESITPTNDAANHSQEHNAYDSAVHSNVEENVGSMPAQVDSSHAGGA